MIIEKLLRPDYKTIKVFISVVENKNFNRRLNDEQTLRLSYYVDLLRKNLEILKNSKEKDNNIPKYISNITNRIYNINEALLKHSDYFNKNIKDKIR